jgi:hypothetical protein
MMISIFTAAFLKRGVAIFAKACFGHPSPSKRQKLNAPANAFGAPIRPRHLVPTHSTGQWQVRIITLQGDVLNKIDFSVEKR